MPDTPIERVSRRLTPRWAAILIWLAVALAMLLAYRAAIATQMSIDPDDALRLVQVRDLLGGQAWWDVTQYRINPAAGGGLMHWSRIVDTPLAMGIAGLSPLVGVGSAERIVTSLVPLLLLGGCFMLLVSAARRLGDARLLWAAPLLLATDYVILYQFGPLRIDHHGWQGLLALAMLVAAMPEPDWRSGVLTGVAGALLIAISIEGLPIVALFGGLIAAEWLWTGGRGARVCLYAYLVTLAGVAALLQFATRGPTAVVQLWCDALSLPWLLALGIAAAIVLAGGECLRRMRDTRPARLATLVVAGVCAGISVICIAPRCLAGPFGTLDPLVVDYWYANVREGLPIWRPFDAVSAYAVAPLLVGMAGYWQGWHQSEDALLRRRWLMAGAATAGMTILAVLVLRVSATAHLFALPGCAIVGLTIWRNAQRHGQAVPRIALSLMTMLALPPVAGSALSLMIADRAEAVDDRTGNADARACVDPVSLAALRRMPRQVILAPLDIGPHLLQRTGHSVVATGHHRNNAAMARSIRVFIGPKAKAQAEARASGATVILACTGAREFSQFRAAPGVTLADQLAREAAPDWLVAVPLGQGALLSAWRIKPLQRQQPTIVVPARSEATTAS